MNKPPDITDEQRQEAAKLAIEARRKRALTKKQLKSGVITFEEVINQADDKAIGRIKIFDFISSLPGIGETKARRIMSELRISQRKRLMGLGNRQLSSLRARLGESNE